MRQSRILSAIAFMGCCVPLVCHAEGSASLDDIKSTWQKRQVDVSSFGFDWTKDVTYPQSWLNAEPPSGDHPSEEAIAAEDRVSYTFKCELIGKDDWLKYSESGQAPARGPGKSMIRDNHSLTSAFDGDSYQRLELPLQVRPYPQGTIEQTSGTYYKNTTLKPLLFWWRPLDKRVIGADLEDFEEDKSSSDVEGRTCCHLVKKSSGKGPFTVEMWVDIERNANIVKYFRKEESSGVITLQYDVSLIHDKEVGWIPAAWVMRSGRDENSGTVTTAEVTGYKINQPLQKEDFVLKFPHGTLVTDKRPKESRRYIVRANNSERIISREDIAKRLSYTDLLNTDSSVEGGGTWKKSVIVGNVLILCVLIGLWVKRKLKARRAS
jgi:hypothetical protein